MSASALYEGWVRHRRVDPVSHEFGTRSSWRTSTSSELPEALDPLRGWSARRPALAWFRRSDHLGPEELPLDRVVRERVAAETGSEPQGPIRMLTNLRYFGHCFNPVTFYFCFDESGSGVEAMLAEVHNTPYGETHAYVLGNDGRERVVSGTLQKEFHVSPLMAMDHVYDWRATVPGEGLQVHIASHRNQPPQHRRGSAAASPGVLAFDATLSLERRELTPAIARRMLARYPALTLQVMVRIYWQALRLRLKGAAMARPPGALDMRPGVALARRVMFAALARIRSGRLELVEGGRTFAFGPAGSRLRRPDRDPRPARLRLGAAREHRARRGRTSTASGPPTTRSRRPDRLSQPRVARPPGAPRLQPLIGPVQRRVQLVPRNTREGARKNISAHYDLGNDLFEAFLDPRLIYSAAVFADPDDDPRGGPAGEAGADLRGPRPRPARSPARDRHRLGRPRDSRRRDPRLPGDDDDDLAASSTATRASACGRGRPLRPGRGPAAPTIATSTVCYDKLVSIEMIEAVGWQYFDEFFAACSRLDRARRRDRSCRRS